MELFNLKISVPPRSPQPHTSPPRFTVPFPPLSGLENVRAAAPAACPSACASLSLSAAAPAACAARVPVSPALCRGSPPAFSVCCPSARLRPGGGSPRLCFSRGLCAAIRPSPVSCPEKCPPASLRAALCPPPACPAEDMPRRIQAEEAPVSVPSVNNRARYFPVYRSCFRSCGLSARLCRPPRPLAEDCRPCFTLRRYKCQPPQALQPPP